MRYTMPNFPYEFEIPDDWIAEADIGRFSPTAPAWRSTSDAVPVPIIEIEPPKRSPTTPRDWRGFRRSSLIYHLQRIVSGAEIEPVPLRELHTGDDVSAPYRYRVRDGYHRFHAAIITGYKFLPANVSDWT